MGTKNNPGQFDCYANAAPDEPMFILLGRDRHAAGLVRLWALLRHRDEEGKPLDKREDTKIAEALQCAAAMDTYARLLGKDPVKHGEQFERLYFAATDDGLMEEHPEGFDQPCMCSLCRSYD